MNRDICPIAWNQQLCPSDSRQKRTYALKSKSQMRVCDSLSRLYGLQSESKCLNRLNMRWLAPFGSGNKMIHFQGESIKDICP